MKRALIIVLMLISSVNLNAQNDLSCPSLLDKKELKDEGNGSSIGSEHFCQTKTINQTALLSKSSDYPALFSTTTFSEFKQQKPVSVGYFGHFIFHPGIKIGTQYDFKEWETRKERNKKTIIKNKSFFVSPQLGFYSHPKNHSGLLLNVDVGYQRIKAKHGLYSAYSIGLGYLTHFNSGMTYVAESNGAIKAKKYASRGYFLPTINYEFGQKINDKMGWYSKISVGAKVWYNTRVSVESFTELGMKFNLGKL